MQTTTKALGSLQRQRRRSKKNQLQIEKNPSLSLSPARTRSFGILCLYIYGMENVSVCTFWGQTRLAETRGNRECQCPCPSCGQWAAPSCFRSVLRRRCPSGPHLRLEKGSHSWGPREKKAATDPPLLMDAVRPCVYLTVRDLRSGSANGLINKSGVLGENEKKSQNQLPADHPPLPFTPRPSQVYHVGPLVTETR